jgi:hypothetical protein
MDLGIVVIIVFVIGTAMDDNIEVRGMDDQSISLSNLSSQPSSGFAMMTMRYGVRYDVVPFWLFAGPQSALSNKK